MRKALLLALAVASALALLELACASTHPTRRDAGSTSSPPSPEAQGSTSVAGSEKETAPELRAAAAPSGSGHAAPADAPTTTAPDSSTLPIPPASAEPAGAAPRPVHAVTAPGSAAAPCAGCHEVEYQQWKHSGHAHGMRLPSSEEEELLGTMIQCADMPATHVLGGKHQVRWLVEDTSRPWKSGRWLAYPCAWDVHEKQVELLNWDNWESLPWESGCAACHTTGFRHSDFSFDEYGVGCAPCHGDGAKHLETMEARDIFGFKGKSAKEEVAVCASCHMQDAVSKSTGLKFPHEYAPGKDLFGEFLYDWDSLDRADPSKALNVHQKIIFRRVARDGDDSLRCTSCHELHSLKHEKHAKLPKQDFCLHCHQPDMTLKEYSVSCNVCQF